MDGQETQDSNATPDGQNRNGLLKPEMTTLVASSLLLPLVAMAKLLTPGKNVC